MHERKAEMAERADAFLVLPGGLGTLEELCEILTWALLGIHQKPVVLINIAGYWDPFLTMLDAAVAADLSKPLAAKLWIGKGLKLSFPYQSSDRKERISFSLVSWIAR